MDEEDRDKKRREIAKGHGFELYKTYDESQAAGFLKRHVCTMRRWRRAGKISAIYEPGGRVRYLGEVLADFLTPRGDGPEPAT